jgi:RimJ/RimL family protein N-acetyltransferase
MHTYSISTRLGHLAMARRQGDIIDLCIGSCPVLSFAVEPAMDTRAIKLRPADVAKTFAALADDHRLLLPVLAELFCHDNALREIVLTAHCPPPLAAALIRQGVATRAQTTDDGLHLAIDRPTFWQQPDLWLTAPSSAGMASSYVVSQGKRHPRRAAKPVGAVYRRYLPTLGSLLCLRVADPTADLDHFHQWMNQDRVHRFWELAGDRTSHLRYLHEQIDDPRVLPLIAEFDGEPFAYFESYWAKEDRIAPYYDADDYDRGCHVLVGDLRHRGPAKVAAWLRGLSHYLFLDDPRTRRIVGEPRVDNTRFIEYLQSQGFAKRKEFDFPHKRSALVMLEREAFFDQFGPWGEA